MEGKKFHVRTGVLAAMTVAMFALFFCLLYYYQIVDAIDQDTSGSVITITTEETVSAARGIITDSNGVVLVDNETVYEVTLDLDDMGDYTAQAAVVERLLEICEEHDVDWTDSELPISSSAPYAFTSDSPYSSTDSDTGEVSSTRLGQLCETMGWDEPEDAEDLLSQMAETFGISSLSASEQRSVLGVLYSCLLRQKELIWTEYTFASDVDIEFISTVKEEDLAGVSITAASERVIETSYAAHLLGRVGLITAENWDEGEDYQSQGYDMDDTVGLSGAEYAFESYLKGTDGTQTITTNSDGEVIDEEDTVPAVAGSDVTLTLDIELQAAVEDALEEYVPQLNNGEGGAAAVVIDVSDGSVLACASWPTYDLSTLTYDEADEDLSPLFNRALQGTYSPGSTYKMVTAIAGLETGVIDVDTEIQDTGYLDYYGTVFRCWLYRQYGTTHGYETVTEAIRDSCNIFFYQVGILLGIDTLTEYAQAFGLGVSSGIELSESLGVNAGPEYSESVGSTWYGGNLLSAAIGQSDNLFTPLQIANYIATLVNGGTRYAAHLLQSVTDADGNVTEYEPQILGTVEISEKDLAAVKAGMLAVVEETSTVTEAFSYVLSSGIRVGAKTGSAQVTGQEDANGLFVCFAPYDDPQIAICVVVEKGGSGAATSVIAARILEAYFGIEIPDEDETEIDTEDADDQDTDAAAGGDADDVTDTTTGTADTTAGATDTGETGVQPEESGGAFGEDDQPAAGDDEPGRDAGETDTGGSDDTGGDTGDADGDGTPDG